jgi:hypothetical protein
VSDHGLHLIEDELQDDWVDVWAAEGISEVESYLGKHADFGRFLESSGRD